MKETPIDKVIESLHVPAPRLWGQTQAHLDQFNELVRLMKKCRKQTKKFLKAYDKTFHCISRGTLWTGAPGVGKSEIIGGDD